MNLHVGHGHVEVGRKDGDEEQSETPTGQELNRARGNQQPNPAEQLENAAEQDAGKRKRDPGRHHWEEEFRMAQMDRPGDKEERGKEQANEEAENQGGER